jgi:hypothetical protein
MVQHMHGIVLAATKFVIGVAQLISFTCDEDSIIDIRANFQFMLMWFRIGWGYQSFFPLSVWWWD